MTVIKEEALQSTNSVMKLYAKLAQLEKEGMKETKEYADIFELLRWEIPLEKNKYKNTSFSNEEKGMYLKTLVSKRANNSYFIYPNLENLTLMRILNYIDNAHQFSLDGIVTDSDVDAFQSNIDFMFLKLIMIALRQQSFTENEKNNLIDFKYGLIATSSKLEEQFLSQELNLPKTNVGLSDLELNISGYYAFSKVRVISAYLTSIADEDIDEETLAMALYMKACIPLLPPLLSGGTIMELYNCIELLSILEQLTGKSREKICNLLYDSIGDNCQLEKNKS